LTDYSHRLGRVLVDIDKNEIVLMNITWYLFPLAAAVSLVWNTSRYEFTPLILQRSLKLFLQIILFMAVILAVLFALSYGI